MKHLLTAALLASCAAFSARAADLPPVLQTIQGQGASIGQSFPGPDGLTGWVVKIPGRTFIVFTTPSGGYAMNGILVDRSGANMMTQYEEQYVRQPAAAKLAAGLASDGSLVKEGNAHAPLLYVYADANCIYCNQLWTLLRTPVQAGKVQVQWAMVSFLKPSSPGRAAAILDAKDRAAALALDETKFDKAKEEGGIPPADPVSADANKALQQHSAQMAEANADGTPLLVFKRGGNWTLEEGMPKDMDAFISALEPVK